eukprot:664937-Rhodomonas_salina.1
MHLGQRASSICVRWLITALWDSGTEWTLPKHHARCHFRGLQQAACGLCLPSVADACGYVAPQSAHAARKPPLVCYPLRLFDSRLCRSAHDTQYGLPFLGMTVYCSLFWVRRCDGAGGCGPGNSLLAVVAGQMGEAPARVLTSRRPAMFPTPHTMSADVFKLTNRCANADTRAKRDERKRCSDWRLRSDRD